MPAPESAWRRPSTRAAEAGVASLGALLLMLVAGCIAGGLRAASDADLASGRPASAQDMALLQDWGRRQGEDWLRQSLGLDITRYQLRWDPQTKGFTFSPPPAAARDASPWAAEAAAMEGQDAPGNDWSLRLAQTQDIARLLRDSQAAQDLPFSMELRGTVPLWRRFDATVVVPLSWRDEWKAEAKVPIGIAKTGWLQGLGLGLGRKLDLHSDLRSRLGQNQWDAGLGTNWDTDWAGHWDLNYDVQKNYGQGDDAASQWLKLSREF